MKDGFVEGLAIRARWTAEAWRFDETREARCGRRVGKSENGGFESRRAVEEGESSASGGVERNGGNRISRSSKAGGSCSIEEEPRVWRAVCGWVFALRVLMVGCGRDGLEVSGGVGSNVVIAWVRRCCFATFNRRLSSS